MNPFWVVIPPYTQVCRTDRRVKLREQQTVLWVLLLYYTHPLKRILKQVDWENNPYLLKDGMFKTVAKSNYLDSFSSN